MSSKTVPIVTGIAVAAAAGAAAYWMNHTTARERRRAIKRVTNRMNEVVNTVVDEVNRMCG